MAAGSPAFGQLGVFGGPGPAHALARCDAKGKVQVWQIFVQVVPTTETRKRTDKDGKEVEYKVTIFKPVPKEHVREVESKDIKVLGGTGKIIDATKLPDLLSKETHVLVTQPNQKVNPLYFKLLKKDALILVLPNQILLPKPPQGKGDKVKSEALGGEEKKPDTKADFPKGQQPQLGQGTISGKTFRLQQKYEYTYAEPRSHRVIKDRKEEVETFNIQNTTVTITTRELDAKYMQFFDMDGKKLASKDVAERLAKETPVLLSADGQKVDPYYLKVFKKDTLIVALPPFAPWRGGLLPKT
jgi:hypothetical protein